ncbi:MAG: pyridoxal phosphate-dependent aminotransferase [Synergistaceae bacterium]|nr:pyridoxal phosphate-dependent aminotransferase [Synergistaceae bacterium]
MKLSERTARMEASATLAMTAKAKALKAEGKPVISFSVGEPDFDTPQCAQEAAFEAIKTGQTHYTPTSGIPELRKAIAEYYAGHFGLKYEPTQIVVGCGAKPLLYVTLGSLIDPGDEVIIPVPAWVSYVEQLKLFDGKEVLVDTSKTGYVPDLKQIEDAITPKTKAIMLNTPSNPTGAVYSESVLKGIAELALKHKFVVIYDEIYERMVYGNAKHYNIVQICPDIKDQTILINGVSKAYAMTGWRIGYALGEKNFMNIVSDFQGHITSNASSVAQWASVAAIKNAEPDIVKMVQAFEKRREIILGLLNELPYIKFSKPDGAFYVWFDISEIIGKKWNGIEITDDTKLCELLLEHKFVAGVMGSAFMTPGFVRLSYASSEDDIREGMKRIKEFLSEIA